MKIEIRIRERRIPADIGKVLGYPSNANEQVAEIVIDGKVLASIYPLKEYGPGVQIVSSMLDLNDPLHMLVNEIPSVTYAVPGQNAALEEALKEKGYLIDKPHH